MLRWTCVALCLAGWVLCIGLLRISGGADPAGSWMAPLCGDPSAGAAFDCQSVLRSHRAFLQRGPTGDNEALATGIPWAAVGAAYFAFLTCWHVLVGRASRRRFFWPLTILMLNGFGLMVSFELTQVMAFELRRWCAGCVLVHAVNLLLFVLTAVGLPWRREQEPSEPFPPLSHALAAVTAGFCLALLHMTTTQTAILNSAFANLRSHYEEIVQDPDFAVWSHARQPLVSLPIRDDDPILGNADAPHTVVAFMDLRCASCRSLHKMLSTLVHEHPQAFRLVLRHYPLDRACNPHARTSPHPGACADAIKLETVGQVAGRDGFVNLGELLSSREDELNDESLARWASESGFDPASLADPSLRRRAIERVTQDIALARELGIRAVPVVFVDGRRFEHWRNQVALRRVLGLEHPAPSQPAIP